MNNFDYKKYLAEGRLLKEEEDDGYDKASRELFDMTWDEVRKQDDPRMRQDVHDEVQKDDEADWGDDVDESVTGSKEKFNVIVKNTGEIIDDGLPKDLALKLAAKKNGWVIKKVEESVNEELTITGEYEGEPVINSGDELEEYLIDIVSLAVDPADFVRKVEFGMTDETSSLSREDQAKLVQFYTDNKQHFGDFTTLSEPKASDYDRVVDGLRSRKIPSRVKLEDSGKINIELGFDFPDSLAGKVFDMLDELGVEADIMAETSARGIESERIFGGPRRDYRREDRDDEGDDEEYYS